MRQGVDADAEFADGIRLLEKFAADAAGTQHQRRGKASDTAPDDNRLHHPTPLNTETLSDGHYRRMGSHSAASGFVASAFSSARVFGLALIFRSSKSCRSRMLLRKICSLPGRYWGGQEISAPYQAAAFSVNAGSTRCGRPSATRSARPAARMVLTWSDVVMLPTHMVATRASLRTCSEKGVWNMRPYTGWASRTVCPVETSIRSTPASPKARAITTASSPVTPPSAQSVPEMRTDIGLCAGHAARIASKTSRGKRRRLPSEPPYVSVRWLVSGEMKL